MKDLLAYEEPDFVVLGGDQISDYARTAPRPKPREWVKEQWKSVVAALVEREGRIPWASILGNHDYGTVGQPDEILVLDGSYHGSLSVPSNDTGYVIPIMDAKGESVATRLYMMHSGGMGFYPRHVNWYREKSQNLRQRDPKSITYARNVGNSLKMSPNVPALAFIHIPFVQMLDIYNSGNFRGVMRDRDGICCQVSNHTMFESFVEFNEIRAVSHGHDHDNSFVGHWEDIALTYGRKAGNGGYEINGERGARVFLIRQAPVEDDDINGIPIVTETRWDSATMTKMSYSIHTWIRLIDGILDEQSTLLAEPPIYKLTKCCDGPPKDIPYALIFAATGTALLVLISLSLLIHGYCRYKRLSNETSTSQYAPLTN